MKIKQTMLMIVPALILSIMPILAQESNTMCTHQDFSSSDPNRGDCTTAGVPTCASTDVADTCFNDCGGDVTCVQTCTGGPTLDFVYPDCCDAG